MPTIKTRLMPSCWPPARRISSKSQIDRIVTEEDELSSPGCRTRGVQRHKVENRWNASYQAKRRLLACDAHSDKKHCSLLTGLVVIPLMGF